MDELPPELVFSILRLVEEATLKTARQVSRNWNEISSKVLLETHLPVSLQTDYRVNDLLQIMTTRVQPIFLNKFYVCLASNISLPSLQLFVEQFGPLVKEYGIFKLEPHRRDQNFQTSANLLVLLMNSTNIASLTLIGYLELESMGQPNLDMRIPTYYNLIRLSYSYDATNLAKLLIPKAPNLKCVDLEFEPGALDVIGLLAHETEIELTLNDFFPNTIAEILKLCEIPCRIKLLQVSFHGSYRSPEIAAQVKSIISALLEAKSGYLKCLELGPNINCTVPVLSNLSSLKLSFTGDLTLENLTSITLPSLSNLELTNVSSANFGIFTSSVWASVKSLRIEALPSTGPILLISELSVAFPNLRELHLSAAVSIQNDLKCCFQHFTQISKLKLEMRGNVSSRDDIWQEITPQGSEYDPGKCDHSFQNMKNLRSLCIQGCTPSTLEAIKYFSENTKFELQKLVLKCDPYYAVYSPGDEFLDVEMHQNYEKELSKFHDVVIIN